MNVGTFRVLNSEKLSQAINRFYPDLSYGIVSKIIKQKDVKVNGKRVSVDLILSVGDEVVFFCKSEIEKKIELLYSDDNILIAIKPKNIETVADVGTSLLTKLEFQTNQKLFPVHRLDRNTEGLVIFAKKEQAKQSLDRALKNRTLEKYYIAWVFGTFKNQQNNLVAYLKKNSEKSEVYISDFPADGYQKIQTNYKLIKEYENSSIVEVELVTGKTHQIRAHFAHIGHFLIGDEKYGDVSVNKIFEKRTQCLVAYKIIFHFDTNDFLFYLNGKVFEIKKENIEFFK